MLRPAGEARQDQKWRVGIMSDLFGRICRYYALRTSHGVVIAYSCQQLKASEAYYCVEWKEPTRTEPHFWDFWIGGDTTGTKTRLPKTR